MRAKRNHWMGWLTKLVVAALVALPLQFMFPLASPATAAVDPNLNSVDMSNGFVRVAASQDFNFGTGDFTMEGWVYVNTFAGWSATEGDLIEINNGSNAYLLVGLKSDGSWRQVSHNGGTGGATANSTTGVTQLNTWNHFALVRNGTNLTTYVNGIARMSTAITSATVLGFSDQTLGIGADPLDYNKGKYNLSNVRIVKGAAVYNFGNTVGTTYFATPSSALQNISGTKLLLATSGTTLASLLTDGSTSPSLTKTISQVRTPALSNLYPAFKSDQAPLSVASSSGTFGTPLTLTTSGGSGTGAVSYTVVSGNCTVSGDALSSTSTGNCVVTATKATDATYTSATSANKTIAIAKSSQIFSYSIASSSGAFKYGDTYTVTMNFPADAVAGATSWNVFKASTALGINSGGDQVCSGGTISAGAVTCTFNSASFWPNAQALNVTGLYVRFGGSTNYEAFTNATAGTKIDLSATACGLVVCASTNAVNVQATNKSISYGSNLGGTGFESPYGDNGGTLRYSITNGANGATKAWGIGCTSTYQPGDPTGTYPIVCTGTTRPSGAPTPVTNAWVIANTNYQELYDANSANALYSLENPRLYASAADWWTRGSFYTSDTYSNLSFSSATLTVSRATLATPTISTTTAVSATSISVAFNGNNTAPVAASYTLRIYESDGSTLVDSAHANYISGTTITGLSSSRTYKVSITAVGDGTNTTSSSATSLATVQTPAPTTHIVTFNKQNNSSAATESVTEGSPATSPTDPTWYGYNFKGWSETINGSLADPATIAITGSKTFYAVWEQISIAGLTSAQLGTPDSIAPHATLEKSVSSTLGNTNTVIKVPAGALPSSYTVKVYTLSDNDLAEQTLGANNTYIISQVVSWSNATDGTIQDTATGKPIEMIITSPDIKSGAKVYSILGNTTTLLATATQNGSVTVSFSKDPVIVVQAAPIVPSSPTPSGGGGSTSSESPAPSPLPVITVAKSFNILGFNPGSWALTKNIKNAIDTFFKSLTKPSKITCVGYTTGPTVLSGDARLAIRRGQEVCSYIGLKNPSIAHVITKGTTTRISSDYYRRTKVTVSN